MSIDDQGTPNQSLPAGTPPPQPVAPTSQPAAQPSAPTPTPAVQPSAPAAQAPTQAPVTNSGTTPRSSLHARIFDSILSGLSGGPVTVNQVDPVTGETRQVQVPQSRSTVARSIVASALSGLMTPSNYSPTPYGPRPNYSADAANAFAAGKGVQDARHALPQKLDGEARANKLMTLSNNANLVSLMAASSHSAHVALEDMNADAKVFMQPYATYEANRSGDQPSAFLVPSATAQEVMDGGHNLTDSGVVPNGEMRSVYNPATKQFVEEPLYAVLNPALGKIQLPEEVTKKLAETNSAFADLFKQTGGNVRMSVNAYNAAMLEYQTVTHSESTLNDLNKYLNGDDAKPISLAPAVRANRQLLPALALLTQANAAGNTTDSRPDNLLHTILTAPNGNDLLKLLGITPAQAADKVDKIDLKRKADAAEAAYAGHIDVAEQNALNKQALEDRKELQKKKNLKGYAEDQNGKLQYVSQWDVEDGPNAGNYSAQTFHEMKPSDVAKDTKLVKPLGDVQMNLNHYRTAANNYSTAVAKGGVDAAHVASDKTNLNTIVSDSDVLDAAAHASAGGFGVSIPTVSLTLAAAKKQKLMDAYNALTPEGKQLADNYARARAAIPAWVKALTDAGRGSKEQLEIELQNLLPPAYEIENIHNRLDGFQDNLNNQKASIPQNLLGTRMPVAVVRADRPPQGATGLVRNNHGEAVGYIVNGRPVDANGDPLGRQ